MTSHGVALPFMPDELAAYRAGEPSWGGSPDADARRRLLATIDNLQDVLLQHCDRLGELAGEAIKAEAERDAALATIESLWAALERRGVRREIPE